MRFFRHSLALAAIMLSANELENAKALDDDDHDRNAQKNEVEIWLGTQRVERRRRDPAVSPARSAEGPPRIPGPDIEPGVRIRRRVGPSSSFDVSGDPTASTWESGVLVEDVDPPVSPRCPAAPAMPSSTRPVEETDRIEEVRRLLHESHELANCASQLLREINPRSGSDSEWHSGGIGPPDARSPALLQPTGSPGCTFDEIRTASEGAEEALRSVVPAASPNSLTELPGVTHGSFASVLAADR